MGEDYALQLNRDAQVNVLDAALPLLGDGSRVVFVTSHQAHFIRTTPTMPEYEPVALSKRAGEDALREQIPDLEDRGIEFVVVSGDMIEGTITATLLERANPGAIAPATRVGGQALQRRRVRGRGRSGGRRPDPRRQHAAGRRHELVRGGVSVRAADIETARLRRPPGRSHRTARSRSSRRRGPISPRTARSVRCGASTCPTASRAGSPAAPPTPRRGCRRTGRGSPSCAATRRARAQIHVVGCRGRGAGAGHRRPARRRELRLVADDGASLAFTARVPEAGPLRDASRGWMPRPRRLAASPASGGTPTDSGTSRTDPPTCSSSRCRRSTTSRSTSPPRRCAPRARPPPKKQLVAHEATRADRRDRHPTRGWCSAATEVLTVVDEIEHDRRDLRSRLIAVRVDGSGERELIGRDVEPLDSRTSRSPRTAPSRSSRPTSGPSGIDFVAPGVALWLLDESGPRRLTDGETIDLGEVGSHITAVGDDFLVQDRTRGRVRLLRVTRSGEVSELLGGDVEVGGHAAAGERIVAAVATRRLVRRARGRRATAARTR